MAKAKKVKIPASFYPVKEDWRNYHFPDRSIVQVKNVIAVNAKTGPGGDTHRLVDANGVSHYIPTGWNHISFKAADGEPAFVA